MCPKDTDAPAWKNSKLLMSDAEGDEHYICPFHHSLNGVGVLCVCVCVCVGGGGGRERERERDGGPTFSSKASKIVIFGTQFIHFLYE